MLHAEPDDEEEEEVPTPTQPSEPVPCHQGMSPPEMVKAAPAADTVTLVPYRLEPEVTTHTRRARPFPQTPTRRRHAVPVYAADLRLPPRETS